VKAASLFQNGYVLHLLDSCSDTKIGVCEEHIQKFDCSLSHTQHTLYIVEARFLIQISTEVYHFTFLATSYNLGGACFIFRDSYMMLGLYSYGCALTSF
jgi:hypothetical protein